MELEIKNLLKETLPNETHIEVLQGKSLWGLEMVKIVFAASDHQINYVSGQYPQVVSLRLDIETMELEPQVFGGNGGRCIYRKPNLNDPKEKYLAMKSVKIPFRKPKKEKEFVLKAIKRFAENWIKALKENREVLMYQNLVDYDKLLN